MIQQLITDVSFLVAIKGQTLFEAVKGSVLQLSEHDAQALTGDLDQMHSPLAQRIVRTAKCMVFERKYTFIQQLERGEGLQGLYLQVLEANKRVHPCSLEGTYLTACLSAVQKKLLRN